MLRFFSFGGKQNAHHRAFGTRRGGDVPRPKQIDPCGRPSSSGPRTRSSASSATTWRVDLVHYSFLTGTMRPLVVLGFCGAHFIGRVFVKHRIAKKSNRFLHSQPSSGCDDQKKFLHSSVCWNYYFSDTSRLTLKAPLICFVCNSFV